MRAVVLLLAGLLGACSSHVVHAPVGDRGVSGPLRNPSYHTVRHGETLYSVAFLYGYEVSEVAAWNGLKPPYTIYKGQRLRLRPPAQAAAPKPPPHSQPKPRSQASAPKVSASQPKTRAVAPSQPKTTAVPAPVMRKSAPVVATVRPPAAMPANDRLSWTWPARGPLLRTYDASGEGRKGINIGGDSGQPVLAAAGGKVVYSGSGLGGYGRLIIIKHNKEFLSAYAHNRKLIANEGQWVEKGQEIALMGNSGTDRVQLHFEIRKHGKPVDPLKYLPRR